MTDTPNDWTDNDLEQLSRIAPSAGAPSDRAGKVREIVEQWLRDNWTIGCPNGCKGDELIAVIESLLDAECKVEVAAALAECAESLMKKYHADFQIGVCRAYELISNFSPSPNYIALREAAARIAEAHLAHGQKHSSYVCGFEEHCWYRERVRALAEAQDRIAKGKQ